MKQKVLITSRSFGNIGSEAWRILEEAGIEGVKVDKFDQSAFGKQLAEYDALIIGAHPLTDEDLRNSPRLKIVCKHGAGVDNIPVKRARELGVIVTNVPGTNSNAVADLACSLMLSLFRRTAEANRSVRAGQWKPFIGRDVYKKRLGLIGFGAIARNVAIRARGFSMDVVAYDPFVKTVPEGFEFVTPVDLNTVLSQSDVVSVHVPLCENTKNLLSEAELSLMKPEAYLINTSRGGIVNEEALYGALTGGRLAGAALDVLEKEPPRDGYELCALDNVIVTPHMGMYSREAISMVSEICARNVVKALSGQDPEFMVEC